MTNANDLSPAELRALADKKEEEAKIRKVGILKHDLYDYPSVIGVGGLHYHRDDVGHLMTSTKKDEIINNFMRGFKLIAPRGTKFNCYLIDGEEYWEDDNGIGIETTDPEWVKNHLMVGIPGQLLSDFSSSPDCRNVGPHECEETSQVSSPLGLRS